MFVINKTRFKRQTRQKGKNNGRNEKRKRSWYYWTDV